MMLLLENAVEEVPAINQRGFVPPKRIDLAWDTIATRSVREANEASLADASG
ncbi:MAG: hypothetical protein AAFP90_23285 [Planctomycetota bacterium]